MATSGTRVLTRTRDEIIHGAYRLLGLEKPGGTVPHPEMMNWGADALNEMILAWQSDGLGLWLDSDATLYMQKGTASYDIGPSGDHCTLSAVETTVDGAVDSGESAIDVDSITGISNEDYIGVELDSGSFQFTTVNGTPSGSTITLTDALTDDVNDAAFVFAYTNKVARPLEIGDIRYVQPDDTELQLGDPISRNEYMGFADKTSTGSPHKVYYHPVLTNGKIYVWQPPDDVEKRLKFTVKLPIEVFTASTDNPAFPQEWYEPLRYSLAERLGLEHYELINPRRLVHIKEDAIQYREKAFGRDTEKTSYQFVSIYGFEGYD